MQVEEQTPLAAAEVYLFTWRGHLCFLPGLPWLPLGRWHLPKPQVSHHANLTSCGPSIIIAGSPCTSAAILHLHHVVG